VRRGTEGSLRLLRPRSRSRGAATISYPVLISFNTAHHPTPSFGLRRDGLRARKQQCVVRHGVAKRRRPTLAHHSIRASALVHGPATRLRSGLDHSFVNRDANSHWETLFSSITVT